MCVECAPRHWPPGCTLAIALRIVMGADRRRSHAVAASRMGGRLLHCVRRMHASPAKALWSPSVCTSVRVWGAGVTVHWRQHWEACARRVGQRGAGAVMSFFLFFFPIPLRPPAGTENHPIATRTLTFHGYTYRKGGCAFEMFVSSIADATGLHVEFSLAFLFSVLAAAAAEWEGEWRGGAVEGGGERCDRWMRAKARASASAPATLEHWHR